MDYKGMDPQVVVDKLAANGIAGTIEPSAVTGSPYAYVYIYLSDKEHEGPHIIISDAAEYAEEGILVGRHEHWELPNAEDSIKTVGSIEAACQEALKLCKTP